MNDNEMMTKNQASQEVHTYSEEMMDLDQIHQGVHSYSDADRYVAPKDPLLLERLDWFQDQKLALMMHFGIYSQPGVVESWSLIDEDAAWSRNEIDWTNDMDAWKDEYVHLNRSFNPVRLRPDRWAALAKETGFRYLIFTTKHHDGFCLWDTATTDYKVTDPSCPFHTNPRADIVKEVFDAFRGEGMAIAAYFSKADWHVPYYWKEGALHGYTRRGPSYDPAEDPETWERFVQYTHQQMMELVSNYGKIDIIWLDGGQVRKDNGQDIRIEEIVGRMREIQPWLLSADRTVGGICENYITPEQCTPPEPLFVPWESCITLGSAFSFRYEDTYKSAREVAGILLDVVSKGGNLALNVAPQPDGNLPKGAVKVLKAFGPWMKTHGEGIYETRVVAPYAADDYYFTRNRKTGAVYAFYHPKKQDNKKTTFCIPWNKKVSSVTWLETGDLLPYTERADGLWVTLPHPSDPADLTVTFRLEPSAPPMD